MLSGMRTFNAGCKFLSFFNLSINSFYKWVPIILVSWLLSIQGIENAEPIAPAPIITILDISIFKKYFFDN